MALGGNVLSDQVLGGDTSAEAPFVAPPDPRLADAPKDLSRSILLEFWDVVNPAGAVVKRVVDFVEAKPGSTPAVVTFDGETYETVRITRSSIDESTDSSVPEVEVSLADPFHDVLQFVRGEGWLRGYTVRLRLIEYDNLDDPALATEHTFRVRTVVSTESPEAQVSIRYGPPPLKDIQIPRISFGTRCVVDYLKRHDHAHPEALCIAGSDTFEVFTRQNFRDDSSIQMTELRRRFGWRLLNGGNLLRGLVRQAEVIYSRTVTGLLLELGDGGGIEDPEIVQPGPWHWENAVREAPFAYRFLPDPNQELHIEVGCEPIHFPARVIGGVLIQPENSTDSLFWGQWRSPAAPLVGLLARHTLADSSTDEEIALGDVELELRVVRTGNSWALESRTDAASSWTARTSKTWNVGAGVNLHVGLLIANDEASPGDPAAAFEFSHFLLKAGGFPTCNRALSDCRARDNAHQFNGFPVLPDGFLTF